LRAIEELDQQLHSGKITVERYRQDLQAVLDGLTDGDREVVDERLAALDLDPEEHLQAAGLGSFDVGGKGRKPS
jgi:hypothetical protein